MATGNCEDNIKETILVVEDDKSLRDGLAMNFELQGYKVVTAADGDEGMQKAFDSRPDMIVLDLMLPGWSGLEILEELREKNSNVPVLILSARDRTRDKIEGLEIGADDYVTKPFELSELLARVEAMLRRRRSEKQVGREISFGDVVIEQTTRSVTVKGEQVELSAREFDLLLLLARSPGRPFTRDVILDRVWGWGFEGTTRTVDNFIMSLRQSIEANPSHPKHIKTVRRVGYKLEP
ncbi:MAG: response regulator transcription factor [Deltaproteobacteria bacterium]|nr:response regulator transcription factor [Deltaproteobacteria bacterium]